MDFFRLEGNLAGEDLLQKRILAESPHLTVVKKIKEGQVVIRYLEFSGIKIRDYVRISIFRPSLKAEISNGNGPAVASILDSIAISHKTLSSMEVLSFVDVEIDERIMNAICLII